MKRSDNCGATASHQCEPGLIDPPPHLPSTPPPLNGVMRGLSCFGSPMVFLLALQFPFDPPKKPKFTNSNSSWIRDPNKNQGLTWPPLYIFLNYIFFSSCYFQDVACKDIIKQFHEYENEEVNNQDIIETRVLGLCCSDKTRTDINGIFCKLLMKILSGSQTNSYCIVSMIL